MMLESLASCASVNSAHDSQEELGADRMEYFCFWGSGGGYGLSFSI